jgi:hypothetical protein
VWGDRGGSQRTTTGRLLVPTRDRWSPAVMTGGLYERHAEPHNEAAEINDETEAEGHV